MVHTLFRTISPIDGRHRLRAMAFTTLEAGALAAAVVSTGYFNSPLVFSMLCAVAVSGFLAGISNGLRLAVATAIAVSVPMLYTQEPAERNWDTVVQWTVELMLVGTVTGYARRITGDVEERHSEALDRLGRLSDANDLLFNLHQVTQDLPASLDLDEVLESTISRLHDHLAFDSAAIVLLEESDDTWYVARRFGARTEARFASQEDLPNPVRRATIERRVVSVTNLLRGDGPGLSPSAGSGLYASLTARGFMVGVLVIEHAEAGHFDPRDAELLMGFTEPAALAIDNARWFTRLRTAGADEERTRIARDLHDRIGQSLAYLAFELDRIVRKDSKEQAVTEDLAGLRDDVRGVVREVRDTLYDLRTDVSDEHTVDHVLREFASRVEERTGLTVQVRVQETARLPRVPERELWRIAQEAIVNAERHADADRIDVFWFSDGAGAVVEVRDDGRGMAEGRIGRFDSYGMLGMRERAASIGASLTVESRPGQGVNIRATLRAH